MNKYKKAIDRIESVVSHSCLFDMLNKSDWGDYLINSENETEASFHMEDDLIKLRELVDKETSMKLGNLRVDTSREFWWGTCQKCRQDIPFNKVLKNINYCDNCGQKIDWSDTD